MVKLFVGNLADSVDSFRLKNLFLQFVHVQECDVLKNFAFVHVITEEDADTAIAKLEKYNLEGREIHVERSTSRLRKEPGMSDKCFTCGAFDHKTPLCPYEPNKKQATSPAVSTAVLSSTTGQKRSDDCDSNANAGGGAKKARFLSSYLTTTPTSDAPHFSATVIDAPTTSIYPQSWGVKVGGGRETDPELPCPQNPELRTLYDQYMESRTRYFFYRERLSKEIQLQVESGGFVAAQPHENKPIHLGTIDLTKKGAPSSAVAISSAALIQSAQVQPYTSHSTSSSIQQQHQQQSQLPTFQPTQQLQQNFVGLANSQSNVMPTTSTVVQSAALPTSSFHASSQPSAIANSPYSTYSASSLTGGYDTSTRINSYAPQQSSSTQPTSHYNAPSSLNTTPTTTAVAQFAVGAKSAAAPPQITRVNLSAALAAAAANNPQNYARSSLPGGGGGPSPLKTIIPSVNPPPTNKFGCDNGVLISSVNISGSNSSVLGNRFSGQTNGNCVGKGAVNPSTPNSSIGSSVNAPVCTSRPLPLFNNRSVAPLSATPSAPPSLLASLKSLPVNHNPYGANPSPYNPPQNHPRMPQVPRFSPRFPSPHVNQSHHQGQRMAPPFTKSHQPPAKP